MELSKTIKIISPLICAYPSAKINADTVQVYAVALSDLDEQELTAAVHKCMRTCKFFPSIAEIRDEAENMVAAATDNRVQDADEAWREVMRQVHDAFIYKKPKFSTPEIEAAALSLGWVSLCETPADVVGVARAQFKTAYEAAVKRKRTAKINSEVLELVGISKQIAGMLPDINPKRVDIHPVQQ